MTPGGRTSDVYDRVHALLGQRFRLDSLVAHSKERVLFLAWDLALGRRVSLRVNFPGDPASRAWFLREAEALAQLDHPAIRHVYELGVIEDAAYRIGNWVEGEGLDAALARGARPVPTVHGLMRDILGALEHAHARGIIVRRIVPTSLIVSLGGRGTITDLRFASHTLPVIPAGEVPGGLPFMAPEVRGGEPGDPASDVFVAGAILYYAITGHEPPLDPSQVVPPSQLRPACPQTIERVLLRALRPAPEDRYLTAAEMYEDFASDAGTFEMAAVSTAEDLSASAVATEDTSSWEKRLRRALGDDYELLRPLGSGGFGRVYLVRDLHLEREVALKVLHPFLSSDPAVLERFRREAQLAARLSHRNIVNIYDIAGRSGLLWYTMEFVDGPSLAGVVEAEGPLPLDRVVRLLREGLSALAHAHGSGLVHRDLKPENMLIETDGSLRITDFGLALAVRGMGRFGGATSQSGTPQFASPEQLLGERVDLRSDLYSLAAVAVYALLGEVPFAGVTPTQVLARQTTNQLPPVAVRRPDVPPELVEVLERALRADRHERFPSAAEFLQALYRAMTRNARRQASGEWEPASTGW